MSMKAITLLSTALFVLVPASALTDEPPQERPSRGVAPLVTGGVFTGLGVLNLATSPLCLNLANEKGWKAP